jgi:hypothetical protein
VRPGSLSPTKGEHFEEDTKTIQKKLWCPDASLIQHHEPPKNNSNTTQSHYFCLRSPPDSFEQAASPTTSTQTSTEYNQITINGESPSLQFTSPTSFQDVVNPVTIREPQQWLTCGFDAFDVYDRLSTTPFEDRRDQIPLLSQEMPTNIFSST